jgi:S-(hydroxymethyl)glutathione dehydrogenase/alcohol dehydrogenase
MGGAHPIIALDCLDNKLAMASRFGATHAVNSDKRDIAEEAQSILGGEGTDKIIETTGVKGLIELAYQITARRAAAYWSGFLARRSRSILCPCTSKRF